MRERTGPWVELNGKRFDVEIADDDAERARGLMFRDAMDADHGMLFIHEREEPQAYWMKNTRIPLDILYFDDARKLVSMQRDVPPCSLGDQCPPYPSDCARALTCSSSTPAQAAKLELRNRRGTEIRAGRRTTLTCADLQRNATRLQACDMHDRFPLPDWNELAGSDDARSRCWAPRC